MKIFIITSLILFFSVSIFAQEATEEYFDPTEAEKIIKKPKEEINESSNKITEKKLDFGLDAGMSFYSDFSGFSGTNKYIAPHINYKFNPKLSLNVGTMIMSNNYNNASLQTGETNILERAGKVSAYIYAQGQYNVNERLRITGAIMYDTNSFGKYDTNGYKKNSMPDYMSVSFDYKISDKMQIGIEFSRSNYNSYYNRLMPNSGMSDAFNPNYNRNLSPY